MYCTCSIVQCSVCKHRFCLQSLQVRCSYRLNKRVSTLGRQRDTLGRAQLDGTKENQQPVPPAQSSIAQTHDDPRETESERERE